MMKKLLITSLLLLLSAKLFADSKKIPALFYRSNNSLLSKSVFNYLAKNTLKGPLIIYDANDKKSNQALARIGKKYCKFNNKLMIGGTPMLFDGKKCYSSDVGVISYLKSKK